MLALPSIALAASPESSLLPGGLPSGLKLVALTGLSRTAAAADGDDELGRVVGGAADERCGLRERPGGHADRRQDEHDHGADDGPGRRGALGGRLAPPPVMVRGAVPGGYASGGYRRADPSGW